MDLPMDPRLPLREHEISKGIQFHIKKNMFSAHLQLLSRFWEGADGPFTGATGCYLVLMGFCDFQRICTRNVHNPIDVFFFFCLNTFCFFNWANPPFCHDLNVSIFFLDDGDSFAAACFGQTCSQRFVG